MFSSEEDEINEADKPKSSGIDELMKESRPNPVKKPADPVSQAPVIRYNPLNAIVQSKRSKSIIFDNEPADSYNNAFAMKNMYMQEETQQVDEPILYDPMNKKSMEIDHKKKQQ